MAETLFRTDQIEVLDAIAAVRRRPGMYVGDVHDGSALHHLLWEVVANSLDEHLAGFATKVRISVEDDLVEVEDDGRGIPIDTLPGGELTALELVLTRMHFSATRDGHSPHVHVSPSRFGLGLAPVNALCQELEVEVWRRGHSYRQRYAQGRALGPLEKARGAYRTGTRLRFRPDASIFTLRHFDRAAIHERLQELAFFNPALRFELMSEPIQEPYGIGRWVERLAYEQAASLVSPPFVTRTWRADTLVELAVAWTNDVAHSDLRSFANQSLTPGGGSHVIGFWCGLVEVLHQRNPTTFRRAPRPSLYRPRLSCGLLGVVHVVQHDPRYAGPTRDRLESPEAREAVRAQLAESLGSFLAEHPELEQALLARIAG